MNRIIKQIFLILILTCSPLFSMQSEEQKQTEKKEKKEVKKEAKKKKKKTRTYKPPKKDN